MMSEGRSPCSYPSPPNVTSSPDPEGPGCVHEAGASRQRSPGAVSGAGGSTVQVPEVRSKVAPRECRHVSGSIERRPVHPAVADDRLRRSRSPQRRSLGRSRLRLFPFPAPTTRMTMARRIGHCATRRKRPVVTLRARARRHARGVLPRIAVPWVCAFGAYRAVRLLRQRPGGNAS